MTDFKSLSFKKQLGLLKKTGQVHSNWYRDRYRDVQMLGMDPAEHYLKYGARMGRNPGKAFDTQFYTETYPEVRNAGLNPLVHYALEGEARGYRRRPVSAAEAAKHEVERLRHKLLSLGFTDQPLTELAAIAADDTLGQGQSNAARELAFWEMRRKTPEGYARALDYIAIARPGAPHPGFLCRLATLEILCHFFLGDRAAALQAWERAKAAGDVDADVRLARTNLALSPEARVTSLNTVLEGFDIPPLRLLEGSDSPYDRLTAQTAPPPRRDGPLVTVLVAAYDAADTIVTTLRSLAEQSWQNLEILVLDDCSPDGGAMARVVKDHAVRDPRIRLIRMERNGGAYVARNRGLDEARGEFVTLHDADDWSHPIKIETQLRHLQDNPSVIGCTSNQARANSDLEFTRWTGRGQFLIGNTSSFLFRRKEVKTHFGYWDTVRFSADNELIRRIRQQFGPQAVTEMQTGPLSFQRDSDSSIIADEALGINGFLFGVRREYFDGQRHFRNSGAPLKFENKRTERPFPVPVIMQPDAKKIAAAGRHFPIVLASDFRMPGGSVASCLEDIAFCKARGIPIGIVEMYRYDLNTGRNVRLHMLEAVRDQIDGVGVQSIGFGEEVSCDLLLLRYPPILQHRQRYVPKINAKAIKVIVNQPPRDHYGPGGEQRYDLAHCAANLRATFGKDATWHPIGPLVRDALTTHHGDALHHIDLSAQDWHNIIDVTGWDRGAPRVRPEAGDAAKLRIGRHSRDAAVKWPATATDILSAYPEADDLQVHVMGGAQTARDILGRLPANWVVHDFDAMPVREFVQGIDIFVYFSHPDWVESFGRTIIEAMAAGVPTILPEVYRPLFGEAALYATPAQVGALARRIGNDPVAYGAQARLAQDYVARMFSYEMHQERLRAVGVTLGDTRP